ncbi:putative RlpA-like domain superfamily, kiwellin [Helianthus debilis subsp. tardiflorus]
MRQFTVLFLVFTFLLTLIISCTNSQSTNTDATMTLNSFEKGGSGGGPSECDGQYHSDDTLIVALSTRWYNGGQRCFKNININYSSELYKLWW